MEFFSDDDVGGDMGNNNYLEETEDNLGIAEGIQDIVVDNQDVVDGNQDIAEGILGIVEDILDIHACDDACVCLSCILCNPIQIRFYLKSYYGACSDTSFNFN